MYKKIKKFFGVLTLVIFTQCKPKPSHVNDKSDTSFLSSQKRLAATIFDTIARQFVTGNELMADDLIELKIIDTSLTTALRKTCYCDTTIQLNDNVFSSVISVNDEAGLCIYFFVTSLNKKSEKVIASKYLHSDCDIDYSSNTYELHEHAIVSKNKIEVTNTTIIQKKDRTSPDEEQNIDHKQIQKRLFTILQTGQINDAE